MYAIRNLVGRALQVDALLETEGGKVLGILVQHLSVENLIAICIVRPPRGTITSVGTHPMIRAAALLMYLPSPSGFLGTGVIGKLSSVRRGAVVAATMVLRFAEERTAVREMFLRPWVGFIRGGGILKMTPLPESRFIQQPGGSLSPDHPSCPLTATRWPTSRVLPTTNGVDST